MKYLIGFVLGALGIIFLAMYAYSKDPVKLSDVKLK